MHAACDRMPRVSQKTDRSRLILKWKRALTRRWRRCETSKILRGINPFVQYFELGSDSASDEAVNALREANRATIDPDLQQKLNMTVQELDLSVRANNCLESAKIQTVRDLVRKTDQDLLKVRSFGKTSLREVKRRLADMGLSLGMDLDGAAALAAATESGDGEPTDEPEDTAQPEQSVETVNQ